MAKIKFVHTNIVSKNWGKLAKFYVDALDCKAIEPERDMKGKWLDDLTNIKKAHVQGIHLRLPGYKNGPTLEIFSYNKSLKRSHSYQINEIGLAHIAFRVDNLKKYVTRILENGGQFYGEISETEIKTVGHLSVVYMRDPDGNIVELQHWS